MCGITGYTGHRQAQPILLDGLERLEYRGYDSAGIAVTDGDIRLLKAPGRLKVLKTLAEVSPLAGTCGIGHTRWATHGEPDRRNAHPHQSADGRVTLVHNGVIENHRELRRMLAGQGCAFVSETDTEVIANLIARLYAGDMVKALMEAAALLRGSFALAVLEQDQPKTLWCLRRRSPLILGRGEGEQFVASDITALICHTRQVCCLEEGQIARLTPDTIQLWNDRGQAIPPRFTTAEWVAGDAEKDGFAHFMLKEIFEQPQALARTLAAWETSAFPLSPEEARGARQLTIAACGTARHAGLLGCYYLEQLAALPARAIAASEFRLRLTVPGELFMAISQSGETADTLSALAEAEKRGLPAFALCNVPSATLPRRVGAAHTLVTRAGPEIAVASTKAYVTQAQALLLFAVEMGLRRGALSPEKADALRREMCLLPERARQSLACHEVVRRFAREHANCRQMIFIGRGPDHALAMEAALKLREVAYLFCEAYPAGELKHGSIALIEPGVTVAAIITRREWADRMLTSVREVKARGAHVLLLCPQCLYDKCRPEADDCWPLPETAEELLPLLAIMPLQLLAYETALCRGCDVDKPRNLAKSVTVE